MSASSIIEAKARRHACELFYVLCKLLEDTQHFRHHCGDPECPVEEARATVRLIDVNALQQSNDAAK